MNTIKPERHEKYDYPPEEILSHHFFIEHPAEFYKFYKSTYKTYFLLSTNCVKLVDEVVGATGSDLLKINGVITPGAYYEYLEQEFKKEKSNVITKQIYTNQNIEKKKKP